ncbi:MAG: metallophosphoesterase [Nanoarchaeota archaeon]
MEKTILKICMQKGFLLDKEMLCLFSKLDEDNITKLIEILSNLQIKEKIITKTLFSKHVQKIKTLAGTNTIIENIFFELGYSRIEIEKKTEAKELINENKLKLISSPAIAPKKVEVSDFVKHFRARYNQIKSILQEKELDNLISLRKISNKKENYSVIVFILDKKMTKNKNILLEVEDPTGHASILINKSKEELYNKAKDLLLDDIVAFKVAGNSELLFANEIIFPDTYLSEKKVYERDEWVAFTSDVHFGSSMFLKDNFSKFIKWLNCEEGDDNQKQIAKNIKYLFLVGDNIDGIGVYPDQEKLLLCKDIRDQYDGLAELLNCIRKDINIIMCPGQHDGVRVAEPQPIVDEKWATKLHQIKNLLLVPNPSLIEIDGGFRILMYHGASMHGIINEIEDLRLNRGHDHPTKVVKEMLKRRHLAPSHSSTVYIPNEKEDPLVIQNVPDIIATGDQHKSEISLYNNILLIASSCWQSKTPFEEKVGNNPDPCKVPLFNLRTREIKILDFS